MKDYYKILEVSENASAEVIHMAYKALVKKYHPDANKTDSEEFTTKMQELNEAYEVLSDIDKRKLYDMQYQSIKKTVSSDPDYRSRTAESCDRKENMKKNEQKSDKEKFNPRWYCSYPVLIITFFLFFPITIVLILIRARTMKKQPKGYRIRTKAALLICAILTILVILGLYFTHQDVKWENQYKQYIENGEYSNAKEMLDEKTLNTMSLDNANAYLDLLERYNVTVDVGTVIQSYYDGLDEKTDFDEELQNRVKSMLPLLDSQTQSKINVIISNVEAAQQSQRLMETGEKSDDESVIKEESKGIETSFEEMNEKDIEETVAILETEKNISKTQADKKVKNHKTSEERPILPSEQLEEEIPSNTKIKEYICEDSDTRILGISDVESFTKDELLLAIDEIYARHGVIFENPYRYNYFSQKSWYEEKIEQNKFFQETELNDIEKENIDFLQDVYDGVVELPSTNPTDYIDISICTEYGFSLSKGEKPISIYIDDNKIGEVGINQYFIYTVFLSPGQHELKVAYNHGTDSEIIETNSRSAYYFTCKYKMFGVELSRGIDSNYLSPDEERGAVVNASLDSEEKKTQDLYSEADYINFIKNGETPTFEKNCKIGYLLESIMKNSLWGFSSSGNKNQVIYTGTYGVEEVKIVFDFVSQNNAKTTWCKVGEKIYDNSWAILNLFEDFENDYLEEIKYYRSLRHEYIFNKPEAEPTLMERDYILPDSNKRYYTADELHALSKEELRYARNEIYARHGYIFDDWDLKNHFLQKSWYHGSYSSSVFDDSCLNDFERKNLETIMSIETTL